jgi:MFS family permease
MATGMAIMGFGGGAMIGAPLAQMLMTHYATPTSVGVWETFVTMAVIYFISMNLGAFGYRLPAPGWKPKGWTQPSNAKAMMTTRHVHVKEAPRTAQFWLVWWALCLNVTAGIGIIGIASPMLQEVFAGQLIGVQATFTELTTSQRAQIAAIAAGFTGLLSLFNIGGRFCWASASDFLGRKLTYYTFFVLGIVLYASAPWSGHYHHVALFVGAFCIILSMYGGGFSTLPAYLADLFGTQMVGAIHGLALTAWSAAGIFGPVIVNYMREFQLAHGVPRAQVYDQTAYILCGLLAIGFICNWFIKPVADKHFMTDAQLDAERKLAHDAAKASEVSGRYADDRPTPPALVAVAWVAVGIPILIGVWITLEKAWILFR